MATTTPHTIRLTNDQIERLTDHGARSITDGIRALIDGPATTTTAHHPSLLRATLARADRITVTVHLK